LARSVPLSLIQAKENPIEDEFAAHRQTETTRIISDIGAANFQLGKTYPFWE
jgi:hypothetical protein